MEKRIRLVALDFEGTIALNKRSKWTWEVLAKEFGYVKEREALIARYNSGKITYADWANTIFDLLTAKGLTRSKFERIVKRDTVAAPGTLRLFESLKSKKIKTAVISGGIVNAFEIYAKRYGIKPDYVSFANELLFDEGGRMTGGKTMELDFIGKVGVLRKICTKEGIGMQECAYIGDELNDLHVFKEVGLPIAINATSKEVIKAAKIVIKGGDVSKVLTYF